MITKEIILGKVSVVGRRAYSASERYDILDAVHKDGDSYLSLHADNIGNDPSLDVAEEHWMLLAKRGESWYEMCVRTGRFEGTEDEFLAQKEAQIEAAKNAAEAANTAAEAVHDNLDAINRLQHQISQAEQDRVKAEQDRVTAETARISAEEARAIAEQGRATSENERAKAEEARSVAEKTRSDAEELRKQAENTRYVSEKNRADAEEARATAETGRTEAEAGRASAEQGRTTAETARKEAEQDRSSAEAERTGAEAAREEAEQSRTTAEQGRADAESLRVEAEKERVTETASSVESAKTATGEANSAAAEAKKQGDYAKAQGLILNENNQKYDTIKQTVDTMEANGNAFTLDIAEGKRMIAKAITDKGVFTREEDSYQQMAANISQIYKGAYDEMFSVEIDDTMSSPEVKRNGSPAFPDWLEANAELVMVKDGVKQYVLDRTTAYKRQNGLEAKVDGSEGDIMVKLPRFWYSPVETATGLKFTFSQTYQRGDGWVESPEIWVGASEGVVEEREGKRYMRSCFNMAPEYRGGDNTAEWDELPKSLLGMPRTRMDHDSFRLACANKGSFDSGVYHQFDYRTYVKLNLMFMCIYGTRHWQASFSGIDPSTGEERRNRDGFKEGGLGDGVSNCPWWINYNGSNPFIKSNVSYDYGLRSGVKEYSVNIGTHEEQVIQKVYVPIFLGIANPFGHIFKAMDGITKEQIGSTGAITDRWALYSDPSKYVSGGQEGASEVIDFPHLSSGYIKKMDAKLLPVAVGGGSISYYADYLYVGSGIQKYAVFHGGSASNGVYDGGFYVSSANGVGYALSHFGGRLCFSPS